MMNLHSSSSLSSLPILFFGGEKGGIGKSTTARHAADYLIQKGYKVRIIDSDKSNPDVQRYYPNLSDIQSLETLNDFDRFLTEEDNYRDTITLVSLKAQGGKEFQKQIEILQDVKNEYARPFFLFFCISNELDSILQLRDMEQNYQTLFDKIIIVKNKHFGNDFSKFENSQTREKLIQGQKTFEMNLTSCDFREAIVSHLNLARPGTNYGYGYREVIDNRMLHMVQRASLNKWIKEVGNELDNLFSSM